jgi:hypothetical protein
MSNIITAPEISINNEADILMLLSRIQSAKKELKRIEAEAEAATVKYMKDNNIKQVELSDTVKIMLVQKKKETWRTEEVFDLFGFTPVQRLILSSPKFRKKELEMNLGDKEEVKKLLDVEFLDEIELKEFDSKYMK